MIVNDDQKSFLQMFFRIESDGYFKNSALQIELYGICVCAIKQIYILQPDQERNFCVRFSAVKLLLQKASLSWRTEILNVIMGFFNSRGGEGSVKKAYTAVLQVVNFYGKEIPFMSQPNTTLIQWESVPVQCSSCAKN